jgi:hypothetical protein
MGWEWRQQDRAAVLECLQRGEYEAIMTSRESALDTLAHLAAEVGVLEAVAVIEIERERSGIPDELLLRTLAVLPFVEAIGLSAAANTLFEDAAILLQLGYTALQIQEGFNQRRGAANAEKSSAARPCHGDVLRQECARINPATLATFRRRCVGHLFERGLVRSKVYAVDGSGLGDRHRLVGLLCLQGETPLWVNWRLLSGAASEKGKEGSVLFEMIDEVRQLGGEAAIAWLLMDALYADGPLLAGLTYGRGIDALVRLPEERVMYADLWQLVARQPQRCQTHLDTRYVCGHKQLREVTVGTIGGLDGWQSFVQAGQAYGVEKPTLWGCAIVAVDQANPEEEEEWALVATRPLATGWQAYTFWRQRWSIENHGYRELKEGWHLERAPWSYTDDTVVLARVTFTLLAYNVAQIAKTKDGRRLTHQGIRRLRRHLRREIGLAPVIVFANGAYGIFDVEEVVTALGRPPLFSVRRPARAPT